MKGIALAAVAALALGGCTQSVNYVMSEYGSTDVIKYVEPASQEEFRIFYNAGSSKLMITPSLGRAFQYGLTYGIAELPPEGVYAHVAMSWLKSTGRNCEATNSYEVIDNQYEVSFTCS